MGANKYENFCIEVVNREDLHGADYNPRRISDCAFKKLKKWFAAAGKGQLAPIVVNKMSMTVVSGHQRLRVLDELNRGKPYQLTVSMVNLDEKTEIAANVFMNNASAMGEFDYGMLEDLHLAFPDISFVEDFGFDESDISVMFDSSCSEGSPELQEDTARFNETSEQEKEMFRAMKKDMRAKNAEANNEGTYNYTKNDFSFVVLCNSNAEKKELMKKMRCREDEVFIKATKLYDIYDHKIKLREV